MVNALRFASLLALLITSVVQAAPVNVNAHQSIGALVTEPGGGTFDYQYRNSNVLDSFQDGVTAALGSGPPIHRMARAYQSSQGDIGFHAGQLEAAVSARIYSPTSPVQMSANSAYAATFDLLSAHHVSFGYHYLARGVDQIGILLGAELVQVAAGTGSSTTVFDYAPVLTQDSFDFVNYEFAAILGPGSYQFQTYVNAEGFHPGDIFGRVEGYGASEFSFSLSAVAAPIPEPETYALMLAGLGVVGWQVRRQRRARSAIAAGALHHEK